MSAIMSRVRRDGYDTHITMSRWDSWEWSAMWPCSTLRGKSVTVVLGDIDCINQILINGRNSSPLVERGDVDSYELRCIVDDLIETYIASLLEAYG